MTFSYPRPRADVWVPDGSDLDGALARTTDLGIVAHQDDLEFMALAPIGACLDDPDRWFTGVACTDGVGSVRTGRYASVTDDEMAAVRRDEQRAAAEIGATARSSSSGTRARRSGRVPTTTEARRVGPSSSPSWPTSSGPPAR